MQIYHAILKKLNSKDTLLNCEMLTYIWMFITRNCEKNEIRNEENWELRNILCNLYVYNSQLQEIHTQTLSSENKIWIVS